MRDYNIIGTIVVLLALLIVNDANAACPRYQSKLIDRTIVRLPPPKLRFGFKVRVHTQYCGGGASCDSTTHWQKPGEPLEATRARADADRIETEREVRDHYAQHPDSAKRISQIKVEMFEITVPE